MKYKYTALLIGLVFLNQPISEEVWRGFMNEYEEEISSRLVNSDPILAWIIDLLRSISINDMRTRIHILGCLRLLINQFEQRFKRDKLILDDNDDLNTNIYTKEKIDQWKP